MPPIRDCRFTAIDFESAGTTPGISDTPIQIGMAEWSVELGYRNSWMSYLFTDQPIQWSAQKVHGIGLAQLAGAPSLLMLWPELRTRLTGAAVVAHGKGTEKRFLRAFPGHGFGPWIDTLHLSRAAYPELASHSLGSICTHFGLTSEISAIVPHKSWHDALYDAVASLVFLHHLVKSCNLSEQSLDVLLTPDTSKWRRNSRKI